MRTALLLFLSVFVLSCSAQPAKKLVLKNSLKIARPDERMVLNRQQLSAFFGVVPAGQVPELIDGEGGSIPSQTDDLDRNGNWDELAFVCSFKPGEIKTISCRYIPENKLPHYIIRTSVCFSKLDSTGHYQPLEKEVMPAEHTVNTLQRYQLEGPAWENDCIGFRNYFDSRNAMDIFGKRTNQMVLDQTDLDPKVAEYMTMQPWGMDILMVAGSLGAGGLGIYAKDSLYRLTGAKVTSFELIARGPVRAVLRLNYAGVRIAGDVIDLHHEISIWAGEPGYHSRVWLTGATQTVQLVAGLPHIKNKSLRVHNEKGNHFSLSTFDRQADSGDHLGMALLLPVKDYAGSATSPVSGNGVTQTYYAKLRIKNKQAVNFWFIAGWEGQDKAYAHEGYFHDLLYHEAMRLDSPVEVSQR